MEIEVVHRCLKWVLPFFYTWYVLGLLRCAALCGEIELCELCAMRYLLCIVVVFRLPCVLSYPHFAHKPSAASHGLFCESSLACFRGLGLVLFYGTLRQKAAV